MIWTQAQVLHESCFLSKEAFGCSGLWGHAPLIDPPEGSISDTNCS